MILHNLPNFKLADKNEHPPRAQEQVSGISVLYRDEPCSVSESGGAKVKAFSWKMIKPVYGILYFRSCHLLEVRESATRGLSDPGQQYILQGY